MAPKNLTAASFLRAAEILRAISVVSRWRLPVLPVLSTFLTPMVPAMSGLKIISRTDARAQAPPGFGSVA
jgi:hypothetical protein